MTETKRRIKELKAALPRVREKIVAVAVMLAMSVAMMASVSYAWYTMSFAPEVRGISTTVTSNGNLEIALSDFDGLQPDSSAVGDSFSARNQTTHRANTSWGNLINLSGNYGIEDLILRPASFSSDSKYYLSSAKYTADGRVEGITTDFAFTTWTETGTVGDTVLHDFTVVSGSAFGVRAISSVGYGDGGKSLMLLKMDAARATLAKCTTAYSNLVSATETVETIRDIVNVYLDYYSYKALESKGMAGMAGMLGVTGNSDITNLMPDLISVFEDFYAAVLLYGEALDELAAVQIEFGKTEATVNLGTAKKTYNTLKTSVETDLAALRLEAAETSTSFEEDPEILSIINRLIDIDSSIINGGGIENKSVKALMADVSGAVDIVLNMQSGTELTVTVTKGNLFNFEKLHGTHATMRLENLKLVGKTVHGTMYTNAIGNQYEEAISITQDLDTSFMNNMVAQDTYGMVVDLWFRTNSPDGTLLTLDGLVETETYYEDRLIKLTGESKSRNVYVYNRPTGAVLGGIELTEEVLVFRGEADDANYEEGCYYNIYTLSKVFVAEVQTVDATDEDGNVITDESGAVVKKNIVVNTDTPVGDDDVSVKRDAYERVIGFSSSNRYDGDYTFTEGNEISATQGTGTCFVFYADTLEASAAALELLGHLKLAYMDADGNMLAQAALDVEHVFAESGKYTVPIVITDTKATAVDKQGNTVYGITAMQKNVPIRISVVVYLDGENLENSMAFSNGSIQGSLNFQFSTDEDLNALKNTDLSNKIIELSAEIGTNYFDKYTGTAQTTTLSAIIDGLDATRVEAVFRRQINATQGSRTQPVTLNHQEGTNTWSGTASFTMPGTYVLNSLWVDGVEYELPQPITVTMSGFSVQHVSFCDTAGEDVAFTADSFVTRPVAVKFATDVQPTSVVAMFESEDGTLSATRLTLGANGYWNGTARFSSSGTYTLKYLEVSIADSEKTEKATYELDENMQKDFTAYLGLRASITLDDSRANISFEYTGPRIVDVKVEILTDNNDVIRGLENVSLNYGKRGSNVAANGLYTELTWQDGAYYGEFDVNKVGVFNFTRLIAGNNEITVATEAPTITAISKEPPVYKESYLQSSSTVQVSNNIVIMSGTNNETIFYAAKADKATTCRVFAVFKHSTSNQTIMVETDYTDTENGNYVFEVPYITSNGELFLKSDTSQSKTGTRNGEWTVVELRFYGAYDQNGNSYDVNVVPTDKITEDSPIAEGAVAKYYVQTVDYSFNMIEAFEISIDKATFGNTTSTAFMTEHSLGSFGATITNTGANLQALGLAITDVKLELTHNGDHETYGGYTYDTNKDNGMTSYTYTLTQNADGKWVVPADAKIRLAGTYNVKLTFKLSGEKITTVSYEKTRDSGITVSSMTPSVEISTITPNGSNLLSAYYNYTYKSANKTSEISSDKHTATIYVECSSVTWRKFVVKTYPSATLKLNGFGSATDAKMTFTGDSDHMYKSVNNNATKDYEWTSATDTCKRYFGYYDGGTVSIMGAGGTFKSNAIVFTYGGIAYTVTLDYYITINQPSAG